MKKYSMSPQQKTIFELTKRYENTCIGNVGGMLAIGKENDEDKVRSALRIVQKHNAALRIRVDANKMLYVSEDFDIPFSVCDHTQLSQKESDARIQKWMDAQIYAADATLVRYYLIKRADSDYILGIYHHLICDGTGIQKITEQVYSLCMDDTSPLWDENLAPDLRYLEYLEDLAMEEENKRKNAGLLWFSERMNAQQPVFAKRRENKSQMAQVYQKHLSAEFQIAIENWCREHSFTIEHLYEAAYSLYYHRITAQQMICLGRVMVNRKKKYLNTVGMFVGVLPLVLQIEAQTNLFDLLGEIRTQELKMLRYSDLTLEEIKKACNLTGRLFDTCFTYRPTKRLPLAHASCIREVECSALEFPLRIWIDEEIDDVCVTYKYLSDCYTQKEISALDEMLEQMIWEVITEDKEQLDTSAKNNGNPPGIESGSSTISEKCPENVQDIVAAFYERANAHPEQIFVTDNLENGAEHVTYEQARDYVNAIRAQIEKKVQTKLQKRSEVVVGLQLSRTRFMPLSMLACLSMGGAFMPISIDETPERLVVLMQYVDVLLTDESFAFESADKNGVKENPGKMSDFEENAIAYCISTSGSTGEPKLVQISRRALNLRLAWMVDTFQMNGCRVLQKTKNTFDVSIWELLLPAMCSGSIVMLPDGWEKKPEAIYAAIAQEKVDKVHFVPSMLSIFLNWTNAHPRNTGSSLTDVFCSGEALPSSLADRFYEAFSQISLHNLYGPAECTIDVTYHTCRAGESETPIGRPVWHTDIKIINEKEQEIPNGYIGEILIVGDLVGEGYRDHTADTRRRFIEWKKKRGYKTGDFGYYNDAQEIVYMGRMDREIKLRGMRVNLATLERESASIKQVNGAAAIHEGGRLLLFLQSQLSLEAVKKELRSRVAPHYMPDRILFVEEIPYNQNGKCDYEKLKQYDTDVFKRQKEQTKDVTQSKLEKLVMECVQSVLKIRLPSAEANFFEYGMDSLSVVSLLLMLEQKGFTVCYDTIYETGCVHNLANWLEEQNTRELSGNKILRPYIGHELEHAEKVSKDGKNKVVIAVPYAGMDGHMFDALADKMTESGWRFWSYDIHGGSQDVGKLARQALKILQPVFTQKNTEVIVLGCCVGSALALETVSLLKKYPQVKTNMVLIGSLPAGFVGNPKRKKLIWDLVPQKVGESIVSVLDGARVHMTKQMYERLKREARMYVSYLTQYPQKREKLSVNCLLLFGKKDVYTLGYQKKVVNWKKYMNGQMHVQAISNAKHFCVRTHANDIAERILRFHSDCSEQVKTKLQK